MTNQSNSQNFSEFCTHAHSRGLADRTAPSVMSVTVRL